jgi:hypothetical protein
MVLAVCVTAYFLLTSWVGVHAYYVDRDRLMRAYAEGEHVCNEDSTLWC